MSTTAEHTHDHAGHDAHDHAGHEAHDHDHPTDGYFVKTALILAIVTALETTTYWWEDWFGSDVARFATPALLIMMTIKFFMILLIFMHLKFDHKLFSMMFYIGLVLAVGVYMVALFTFKFFAS